LVDEVIKDPENELSLNKIRKKVHKLTEQFPLYTKDKKSVDLPV